jgi:hypothetical protein
MVLLVGIEEDEGELFTDENRDHQDDGDHEETDMSQKQSGSKECTLCLDVDIESSVDFSVRN